MTHSLTESHLHFKQFAPDRCHKVQDPVLGSREPHSVNEQGKEDEVRKYGSEVHNLCDANHEKQKLISELFCCGREVEHFCFALHLWLNEGRYGLSHDCFIRFIGYISTLLQLFFIWSSLCLWFQQEARTGPTQLHNHHCAQAHHTKEQ